MPSVRVLDLDGSLVAQTGMLPREGAEWVTAREWAPHVRLACPFATFRRFQEHVHASMARNGPALTFYGSGDFHHVTLALLARIEGPFNLLVLDKHPDWMRRIPFLHCGTWVRHALRLPNLKRAFLCGGETDFDNPYRWLAPWPEIRSGRVVVFPARRRFVRGGWRNVPQRPLLEDGASPADVLRAALRPFRDELRRYPLYVSVDKDVLVADEAGVNWDSGLLRVHEALTVLETFLAIAGGRLVGADVLGDWSPMQAGHWLNRVCHRVHSPRPVLDPSDAAATNQRTNAALLGVLLPALDDSVRRAARRHAVPRPASEAA